MKTGNLSPLPRDGSLFSLIYLPFLSVAALAFSTLAASGADGPADLSKVKRMLDTANSSPGVAEVLKLSKAGVEEPVIVSFVQNSSVAYSPSADEVVQLRESGISTSVITAMLQRGAELRQRMEAAQAAQAAAPAPAPAPAPVVAQPATYPDYSPVYYPSPAVYPYPIVAPTVVYGGYGYGGGYGGYGGYCGPRWAPGFGFCGPRVGVGVRLGGPIHVVGGFRGGGFRGGGIHHR